jgi:hypothetical protein
VEQIVKIRVYVLAGAATITITLALVLYFVILSPSTSDKAATYGSVIVAGISIVVAASTSVVTWSTRSRVAYRKIRIALVGAPRVGKTVYLTVLFDLLQSDRSLPFGFAPDPETINRVLGTMDAFSEGRWIGRTPSDYLYLYSARLSLQRSKAVRGSERNREYRLEIADVAGEQVGEFVPGERQYSDKTSYYSYARGSDGLFLFIDYPAIDRESIPTEVQPLSRQINDLIFVIQSVADAAGIGPDRRLESPVAIIITKCDLALISRSAIDGHPHLEQTDRDYLAWLTTALTDTDGTLEETVGLFPVSTRNDLSRLFSVATARCRWVALFAVSSVGPTPDPDRPPQHIQPVNVAAPLTWMLEPRHAQIGRLVRE